MKIRVQFDESALPVVRTDSASFILESDSSLIWKIPPERSRLIADLMVSNGQPTALEGIEIKEEGFSLFDLCKSIAQWIWAVVKRLASVGYEINRQLLKDIFRMFMANRTNSETKVVVDRQLNVAFSATELMAYPSDDSDYSDDEHRAPFKLTFVEEKRASWVSSLLTALGSLGIEVILLAVKTIISVIATHYTIKYLTRRIGGAV
jgi:hypothetical protein